jgi:hypothetical protein
MLARLVALLIAAQMVGCDEDPQRGLDEFAVASPLPVDNGLFYTLNRYGASDNDSPATSAANVERALALTVDLSVKKPRIVKHELPAGFARSQPRPGAHQGEVVVLTSGHDQYRKKRKVVSAENGHVLLLNRERQLLDVELGGNYNQLTLSDDGRFAVVFAPTGNQAALNAIEVVDLEASAAAPGENSELVTLGLDGRTPTSLLFSPVASGFSRRLLVVLFPDTIQLLDLEHPQTGAISVPLKSATDNRTLQPRKVLFHREVASGRAPSEKIYIQSQNSNQVMVLDLLAATDKPQGFRPAPTFIPLAANISDIDVVGSGATLRLVALAEGLEIVDPEADAQGATQIEESVRIPTANAFSSLHTFEGSSPVDTQKAWRAMLYQQGQPRIGFVEIGGQSTWGSRAVEVVELGVALQGIIPLKNRKVVLGMHGGQRISIIDLEQRRVVPISLESGLASFLLDETEQHARLWTANQSGIVSVLDLVTRKRTPIAVALDATSGAPEQGGVQNGGAMVLVPGPVRRVALIHAADSGRITLLNADFNPDDADATLAPLELVGFFYSGLFD